MKISTLKNHPEKFEATISLIEKAFGYKKPNNFQTDFSPLIDKSNFLNCYIALDENEKVVAHIGVCETKILDVPVAMLGGIAVDEAYRGQGIFHQLMQEVLADKRSDVAFFLLWSDQASLYKKYGFHLCGTQLEFKKTNNPQSFHKTKLKNLTDKQIEQLNTLFNQSFANVYTTPTRSLSTWGELTKISSADLYLKEQNQNIEAYFFMNKGQDLNDIIYEYASNYEVKSLIQEISGYGKVWAGGNFFESEEVQFQFFLAPSDTKLFSQFIKKYTNGKMLIHEMNPLKQEVYFYFGEELLSLETEDFLRGVFGPGIFEEIEDSIKPIFISGLISI